MLLLLIAPLYRLFTGSRLHFNASYGLLGACNVL